MKDKSIESRKIKQKETFLESLKRGTSITKASDAAGIDYSTVWLWRKKSKSFNNKVLAVLEGRTQIVEDSLYMNAIKNNVVAQIFWLKNRGKGRWKDKFEHDINDHNVIFLGKKEKPEDKEE